MQNKNKSKSSSKRSAKAARKPRDTYHHGDTRAALIKAATDLVYEHGTSGFSLRKAARIVGVDPTVCYRHFRNRGEILIAIAQHGFLLLSEDLNSVEAKIGSKKRIEQQGYQYICFAQKYPAHFRLMFGECGIASRDPRMRPVELEHSAYDCLEESLNTWASVNGHEIDINHTALLLWAGVHGLARLILDGAVPLEPEQVHTAVLDLASSVLHLAAQ